MQATRLQKLKCSVYLEIFERAVKHKDLRKKSAYLMCRKKFWRNIQVLWQVFSFRRARLQKSAVYGGQFPVMCVTLMNPRTGGVFASFGAHPNFKVALERSLTELLQGRSFEGLNDLPQPTFSSNAVTEPNNYVEHFIDSSGACLWRFFSAQADFEFVGGFTNNGQYSNVSRGFIYDSGRFGQRILYGGI